MKWRMFSLRRRLEDRLNRAFDAEYGVETSLEVDLAECASPQAARARANRRYRAISGGLIDKSLQRLDVDHRRYVFVDLGAGKGKAMLRAANYPYRRIIGVEIAEALFRIAVSNCRIYRSPDQKCFSLEPVHADALDYQPPPGPLICFICDPLDHDTLARLFERLRWRVERGDRDLRIIYVNMNTVREADPVLREETWLRRQAQARRFLILAPERQTWIRVHAARVNPGRALSARSLGLATG